MSLGCHLAPCTVPPKFVLFLMSWSKAVEYQAVHFSFAEGVLSRSISHASSDLAFNRSSGVLTETTSRVAHHNSTASSVVGHAEAVVFGSVKHINVACSCVARSARASGGQDEEYYVETRGKREEMLFALCDNRSLATVRSLAVVPISSRDERGSAKTRGTECLRYTASARCLRHQSQQFQAESHLLAQMRYRCS